jgi:hypothetical protein
VRGARPRLAANGALRAHRTDRRRPGRERSVHLGVPYIRYAFNSDLRGDELLLGDVPLMVPLSYTFMAYFAFSSGRLLASGPWRTRASRPWHEWLLALILAVWALWVLDPVSRLGHRFYLGELLRYDGPGFWFGLPLGSQLGFAATAAILLATLFHDGPSRAAPADRRHRASPAAARPDHLQRPGRAPRDRHLRHRRRPCNDRRLVLPHVDPGRRDHGRALEPLARRARGIGAFRAAGAGSGAGVRGVSRSDGFPPRCSRVHGRRRRPRRSALRASSTRPGCRPYAVCRARPCRP